MTIDEAFLAERERIMAAATKGYPEPKAGMTGPWSGWHRRSFDRAYQVYGNNLEHIATVASRDDATAIVDAVNYQPALIAEIRRLRVKRCHHCDAPMIERDVERDGVMVGVAYQCTGGCP